MSNKLEFFYYFHLGSFCTISNLQNDQKGEERNNFFSAKLVTKCQKMHRDDETTSTKLKVDIFCFLKCLLH